MSTDSSQTTIKQEASLWATIPQALEEIKNGGIVIVMDDEDRENEGDLIMAADKATPEKIAFFVNYTTGILCAPMPASRAAELQLPLMVNESTDPNKTAYTISTDALDAGTGVSAADRCMTFNYLANPSFKAKAFRRPGHIFPLIAKPNGVWERRGHTEAATDLCKLAGVSPVGVIGELVNKDGSMKRLPDCVIFAKKYNLKIINIEQILAYRFATEPSLSNLVVPPVKGIDFIASCELPIRLNGDELGPFTLRCFYSHFDGRHHISLERGDITREPYDPVLTRVHSECFTGDCLGSQRCDCGEQLYKSLKKIAERGRGVLVYVVGHEGRGIGLARKIFAYHLQQTKNLDTYKANEALGLENDYRRYDTPRAILTALGVKKIKLLTNNQEKASAFGDFLADVEILKCVPNKHNAPYLNAKQAKTGYNTIIPGASAHVSPEQNGVVTVRVDSEQPEVASIKSPPINLPKFVNPESTRILIIRTAWNEIPVKSLTEENKKNLLSQGVQEKNIREILVPGSYEIPIIAKYAAESGKFDAIIALGVLIKGDTLHFEMVSVAVTQKLMDIQVETGVPIINGVLNCLTEGQVEERCKIDSTISWTLPASALHMASIIQEFKNQPALNVEALK